MLFSANLSILFTERPFLDRFAAARSVGFDDVECWWPFPTPTPSEEEVRAFLAAIENAGVSLRALNLFAGDMPRGDRGILSHPGSAETLEANVAVVARIASATGCRAVNALYGVALPGVTAEQHAQIARENLHRTADALAPHGVTVLIEPLTRGENGTYPLETIEDALTVIDDVDHPSVRLLFDAYHLHNNGADVVRDVAVHADRIGHVQIADSPGRGEPGSGHVDFPGFFAALERIGYDGFVGCEYRPTGPTAESFGWLEGSRRAGRMVDVD